MSIDEDDYIPKKPTPSQEQEGYFGQESVVGINVIPVSQPPSQSSLLCHSLSLSAVLLLLFIL